MQRHSVAPGYSIDCFPLQELVACFRVLLNLIHGCFQSEKKEPTPGQVCLGNPKKYMLDSSHREQRALFLCPPDVLIK